MLEFIEFESFSRKLQSLAEEHAEDVLLEIQNDLLDNPERGAVIQGTGGVRKARVADPKRGKGKSGGFRYMYFYIQTDEQIFLIMVFGKNEQDNLTSDQKKALANATKELREAKK